MRLTDQALDKAMELSLENLRKNLEESGGNSADATMSKTAVLQKAREAVQSGKLDLLAAGNIEQRINKGVPLSGTHRAILGLSPGDIIEGLREPAISNVSSRMGEASGGSAAKIGLETGAPSPSANPIIEAMAMGQKMSHSFQAIDGTVNVVSGAEVLRKCQELIKKGMMTLTRAADVERLINSGAAIRPGVLKEIFEV